MATVDHHLRGHHAEPRVDGLRWLLAHRPGPQAPATDHGDSDGRSTCLLVTVLYRNSGSTAASNGHHLGPREHDFRWKLPPSHLPSPPSR